MVEATHAAERPVRAETSALDLEAFKATEWGLLVGIALMWGSSFLFIEEGLESFRPPLIALLRLLFGVATLAWFARARTPIERSDWRAIGLLAIFWMAVPFLLFPLAQQWIDSSLAGMINGGVPVFAALVAAFLVRRIPSAQKLIGIGVGFAGVVLVSWPAAQGARATALGVILVLIATASYGVAVNIAVPLQRRYGSLPVLLRTQIVALALVAGPGALAAMDSSFSWGAFGAMVPLGFLGTGLAFVAMTTLVGKVGAARGSIAVYFIPVVAIALGAVVRDETISAISIFGTALVILGAFLASRQENGANGKARAG